MQSVRSGERVGAMVRHAGEREKRQLLNKVYQLTGTRGSTLAYAARRKCRRGIQMITADGREPRSDRQVGPGEVETLQPVRLMAAKRVSQAAAARSIQSAVASNRVGRRV